MDRAHLEIYKLLPFNNIAGSRFLVPENKIDTKLIWHSTLSFHHTEKNAAMYFFLHFLLIEINSLGMLMVQCKNNMGILWQMQLIISFFSLDIFRYWMTLYGSVLLRNLLTRFSRFSWVRKSRESKKVILQNIGKIALLQKTWSFFT